MTDISNSLSNVLCLFKGEASNDTNGVIAIVIGTSIFGVILCFGILISKLIIIYYYSINVLVVLAAFVCWKHKAHSKKVEIGK